MPRPVASAPTAPPPSSVREIADEPIPYRVAAPKRMPAARCAGVLVHTAEKVQRLYAAIGHLASMHKSRDVIDADIVALLHVARHIECDVDEMRGYLEVTS